MREGDESKPPPAERPAMPRGMPPPRDPEEASRAASAVALNLGFGEDSDKEEEEEEEDARSSSRICR